jgi:phosphate-selective porin OprO/OprP
MRPKAILSALLCLLLAQAALARNSETTILLRNATLIDRDEGADRTVNILIKNTRLDIITEDLIPIDDADEAYNAEGGVILGQLNLGQPASFMVLNQDPRENFDALLDTKTHVTFAVANGQVVRNRFVMLLQETQEEQRRAEQGWLAYSPPPLAVPLDYQDTGRWNRFDTRYVSGIAVAGLVLDRMNWVDQDSGSLAQVGDLDSFEGGEIRGLRVGGVGTINFDRPWIWTFFGATHAFDKGFDSEDDDSWSIFDARLDIPFWEKASFSIGKQKEPISMERIMSLAYNPQQERAAVSDALMPARNVGIVMAGTLFDDRMTLAGGAFNNWLDKDQPNSFSDNAVQYIGRATALPWKSENESSLLHLGVGLRYSDAAEGVLVRTEPEFNQSPAFVDTGIFAAEDMMTYQGEISLRSGPFWLHSEYVRSDVNNPLLADPVVDGYHVTASWVATGEVRGYNKRVGIFNRLPISRTVHQNGWGAWEYSLRFSNLDANDGGLEGGDLDIWSAGVNWWLTPYMNLNLNYRYVTLDRLGIEGDSQGVNMRVTLLLE